MNMGQPRVNSVQEEQDMTDKGELDNFIAELDQFIPDSFPEPEFATGLSVCSELIEELYNETKADDTTSEPKKVSESESKSGNSSDQELPFDQVFDELRQNSVTSEDYIDKLVREAMSQEPKIASDTKGLAEDTQSRTVTQQEPDIELECDTKAKEKMNVEQEHDVIDLTPDDQQALTTTSYSRQNRESSIIFSNAERKELGLSAEEVHPRQKPTQPKKDERTHIGGFEISKLPIGVSGTDICSRLFDHLVSQLSGERLLRFNELYSGGAVAKKKVQKPKKKKTKKQLRLESENRKRKAEELDEEIDALIENDFHEQPGPWLVPREEYNALFKKPRLS